MAKAELLSFQLIGDVYWTNDQRHHVHEEFDATEETAPEKARAIVSNLHKTYSDHQDYELTVELRVIRQVLRITSLEKPDNKKSGFSAHFREKKL